MVGGGWVGGMVGEKHKHGRGGQGAGRAPPKACKINLRRTLTGEQEVCASVLRAAAYNLNQVRVGLLPLGQQGQQPLTDAGMREVGDDFLNLVAHQRTNAPTHQMQHGDAAEARAHVTREHT
jgi:hypothetical protein